MHIDDILRLSTLVVIVRYLPAISEIFGAILNWQSGFQMITILCAVQDGAVKVCQMIHNVLS